MHMNRMKVMRRHMAARKSNLTTSGTIVKLSQRTINDTVDRRLWRGAAHETRIAITFTAPLTCQTEILRFRHPNFPTQRYTFTRVHVIETREALTL